MRKGLPGITSSIYWENKAMWEVRTRAAPTGYASRYRAALSTFPRRQVEQKLPNYLLCKKMMNLRFTSATEHPPGTVYDLLQRAWAPLWNPKLEENIRRFDREVLELPQTVGACTFVTCLDAQPVGMGSYDPRQKPERGIIGWNCVVPEQQGWGIGKVQIQEIVRIFRSIGIRKACVTTTDEDFFVPAQRTYEACGFVRVRKTRENNIEYELGL
jgi:GNAT superfamily N-acetyltransferase